MEIDKKDRSIPPKKHRVENIDVLRGIAIILMVMGHTGFGYAFDKYIHIFHMPIWFFISGYFFREYSISWISIVYRKFMQLLLPYFFWGLFQYIIWILFVPHIKSDSMTPLRNLLWINTNGLMPIAGALWFLTALFFTEILFLILFKLFKDKKELLGTMILIISLIGNFWVKLFNIRLPWAIDTSFVAIGFYYLGYIFKKYKNTKIIKFLFRIPFKICVLMFLINTVSALLNGYVNLRIGMYGFIPLFWINALMAIFIYWSISKYICEKASKYTVIYIFKNKLSNIGRLSIIYLCLNQLAIYISNNLVDMLKLPFLIKSSIDFIFALILLYLFRVIGSSKYIKKLFGML